MKFSCELDSKTFAQEFLVWLEQKPDEEVVGYRRDGYSCPLARFLADVGYEKPYVDKFHVTEVGKQSRPTSLWEFYFVLFIDEAQFAAPRPEVTTQEALQALYAACQRAGIDL